jgi:hypothetical protein
LESTTIPWQVLHAVELGWGAAGGSPWHVPQAAWLPFTVVQVGVVTVPPGIKVAP